MAGLLRANRPNIWTHLFLHRLTFASVTVRAATQWIYLNVDWDVISDDVLTATCFAPDVVAPVHQMVRRSLGPFPSLNARSSKRVFPHLSP